MATTILGTGDIVFRGDPEAIVAGVAARMRQGDVVVGHVETPYTLTPARTGVNQVTVADPQWLRGLNLCGINVATLAGNHIWDAGLPGLEDTLDFLDAHGIARTGAGRDIADAKRLIVREHDGNRIGVLSYNCTGPRDGWATANKAGTNYIHIITHYDLDHDCPGGSPSVYSFPTYPALDMMKAEIAAAKAQCDVLVVAMHKGILHTPVVLADYERPLAHAAIDAGADAIFSHHAHILRGIELYRGRPIYHGLNNFILPSSKIVPTDQHPQDFTARRARLYNFDYASPAYRFHPDAMHSIVAQLHVEGGKLIRASYLPMHIDENAFPVIIGRADGGEAVFDYVARISAEAGLAGEFAWDGDEVVIVGT